MFSFSRSFGHGRRKKPERRLSRKPHLESLEERQLMTLAPVANSTSFPFSAVVNVVSLYHVADATGMHTVTNSGTGTLVGPHDVLTVAHTIEHAGLPAPFEILVFPGRNGLYDRPFGQAIVTHVHINPVYNPNTANDWNQSALWDLAILDLDRNIGSPSLADWVAFGWENDTWLNQIVNTLDPIELAGYPTGVPATPAADGTNQFFDTGPVQYDPAVYGSTWLIFDRNQLNDFQGDSGAGLIDNGPNWNYPTILGVEQSEFAFNGMDLARAVRITQPVYNWLLNQRNSDPAPVDRSQVMDRNNWFNSTSSSFTVSGTARPGSKITVNASIWNGGTAKAGKFTVSFYLSTDPQITGADILLGSKTVSSLGALRGTTVTRKGKLPRNLPKGNFHVGWMIDPTNNLHGFPVTPNARLGVASKTGFVRTHELTVA
jgi:hypothetical protein